MIEQHKLRKSLPAATLYYLALILLITLAVTLPAVNDGLSRDDFYHRNYLLGNATLPTESNTTAPKLLEVTQTLFSFFNGDKNANLTEGKRLGWIPWWASSQLKIDFWRPIAAVSHWIDYKLWPDHPSLMHLHNIFWYLALATCVSVLFVKLGIKSSTLLLGTGLYALDASHSEAVAWIANRNILISTTFGLLSLTFLLNHLSPKRNPLFLIASLIFLILALLSAEGGIAILPFMILATLMHENASIKNRFLIIISIVLIFVSWQIAYRAAGYGASHSGVYLDPIKEARSFLENGLIQWPILLMDQITGLESLQILLSDSALKIQAIIAYVFCIVFFVLLLPMIRQSRLAVFFLLTGCAALIPAGTTILTGGRLMFFAGISLTGLMALYIDGLFRNALWVPNHRGYKITAKLLVALLLLSQVSANGFIWYNQVSSKLGKNEEVKISKYTDFSHLSYTHKSTIVYLNPPLAFDMMYVPDKLKALGKPIPKEISILASGISSLKITRKSENVITIECELNDCPLDARSEVGRDGKPATLANGMQRLDTFFSASDAAVLDSTSHNQMRIQIIKRHANGLPKEIEYQFIHNLSDTNYVLVYWDNTSDQIKLWTPPSIGESINIDGFNK